LEIFGVLICQNIQKKEQSFYNLLIVEDVVFTNDALCTLLARDGKYKLSQAYTFAEADVLLSKNQYDFILLDLHLPDAEGEDLVEAIQKKSDAKIIVLTAEINIEVREHLFYQGILDYLVKEDDLLLLVASICSTIETLEKNRQDTILIVENSPTTSHQLQNILQLRNYNVVVSSTTQEALILLESLPVSSIILEKEFQTKDDLEFLTALNGMKKIVSVPIIVLLETNNPEIIRKALKNGASDVIQKPFNIEEFTLKVDMFVEIYRRYIDSICSQKLLSEYKEAIDQAAYVSKTDIKGKITYVNELFCRLSGYTQKELLGKAHNIVRHPDVPKSIFREMWHTIQAKKIWKGTIKNRKKNGQAYYVKSMIKPIVDLNGNIIEYIAIRTDVTDLEIYKEILEENLNISNNNLEYLKQYEEAMDEFVAVIKTNIQGTITYVNNNFSSLSGYTKNELLGMNCKEFRSSQHMRNGDCESVFQGLQNQKSISILFENLTKEKENYFVDTKIYPLKNGKNEVVEHLHLMYDVTEIVKVHEELEDTQKEIINTMGEVGESRSQETGNHVRRVAYYSKKLAHLVGLSDEDTELLYSVSPMHDLGKVGIPDSILKKPGKLTEVEFEIMKTHAEIGFNILKNSKRSILQTAAIVAYTHHEKWDGSGYPNALAGEDIHIFGRITAIADVFDALGSDRIYKKSWPLEKIIRLFKEERGKHFDPRLVDIFLENLDDFLVIRDHFKD